MRNKLIIVFIIVVLSISGCQTNEEKVEMKENSKEPVDYNTQETNATDITVCDDLVYKEYSLGEKFHSGEITISKETILSATKEPRTVVVYFNDEIYEAIDYNGADIQIDLTNHGMYCFMIVNKDNESVDITSQVQGTSYSESGAEYLRWRRR